MVTANREKHDPKSPDSYLTQAYSGKYIKWKVGKQCRLNQPNIDSMKEKPTPLTKEGDVIWVKTLKPKGWTWAIGLDSVFYVPGHSSRTNAVEGLTKLPDMKQLGVKAGRMETWDRKW